MLSTRELSEGWFAKMPASAQPRSSGSLINLNGTSLAESARAEILSGPALESVPSSYSTLHHERQSGHHRAWLEAESHEVHERRRSQSMSTKRSPQFNGSQSQTSLGPQHLESTCWRDDDRARFAFFSQSELKQAEGASIVLNELEPVGNKLSRKDSEDEEYLGGTPHQHSNRHSYQQTDDHDLNESPRHLLLDSHVRKRRRSFDQDLRRLSAESDIALLSRMTSQASQEYGHSKTFQQRFHISEEDMTIYIAGYRTTPRRKLIYQVVCTVTLGLACLLFRWFARWKISCIGVPAPLGECDWVVIENQWGELSLVDVQNFGYNRQLSTVFRTEKASTAEERSAIDTFNESENNDQDVKSLDADLLLPTLRTIEYRHIKLFYHPSKDKFLTNTDWVDKNWANVQEVRRGIDNKTRNDRYSVFGPNIIDMDEKSTSQLLVDEILHPFYIFQLFSIILWAFDRYYYYAACIFLISAISIANTLIETKQTLRRMRDLARFECDVRVFRDGYWASVNSSDLVPGDIYEVSDPTLTTFPCDSILLSGDCIVNESMLTGESVPVSKFPATDKVLQSSVQNPNEGSGVAKHFLYSGTRIVQVRRPPGTAELDVAVAMVLRTGFMTEKGALVRSMLFPKPTGFKFYKDSFKYIGIMALIAVIGFAYSCVGFIRMHMDTRLIVTRALDLITVVVPPALPATLTIGTNIALSRLRKKSIFCISPSRVNVGGKLDVICFDKTGTLTEDGLDVLGTLSVKPSNIGKSKFSKLQQTIKEITPPILRLDENSGHSDERRRVAFVAILATCHSLRRVDGVLIGDPLDLKMFEYTDWNFHEDQGVKYFPNDSTVENPVAVTFPNDESTHIGVIHSFEFVSKLRRMSVLAKEVLSDSIHVFLKGAPEVMTLVCDPSTLPIDYNEQLHYFTHQGYRVIACATKTYTNMSSPEARHLKRSQVESNLTFMGFIVFENKLKPSTTAVIEQLSSAEIRTVMCTGDNVLTAVSVAKECKIVKNSRIFVPHFYGKSF